MKPLSLLQIDSMVVIETQGDVFDSLFQVERKYLTQVGRMRRSEFSAVRHCAIAALSYLGYERPVMVPGLAGEPTWPEGVAGSMTHCPSYCAAAVAPSDVYKSIGIDAEPNESLSSGMLERIASFSERTHVQTLSNKLPNVAFDRLLFCIKESVYKAWFHRFGECLRFKSINVNIEVCGSLHFVVASNVTVRFNQLGYWNEDGGILGSVVAFYA